jgi:ubiquinone/menaquinone biosynthesis C-methylase UbiE
MRSWAEFWMHTHVASAKLSAMNMKRFLTASNRLMEYGPEDVLLDYGCGFADLAVLLHKRVREIHCVDISERFLQYGKKRLRGTRNVFFHGLKDKSYTDLSCFVNTRFSKVVCLSVIQYFKNIEEVEELIQSIQSVILPGGRCLIADIPNGANAFVESLSIMKWGLKEGCFTEVMKHLLKLMASDYAKVRGNLPLLVFSDESLFLLSAKLGLDADVLRTPMTLNSGRNHWLIRF